MAPRGGARPGAGRKPGSNDYGESTRAIRVPLSLYPEIQGLLASLKAQRKQGIGCDRIAMHPVGDAERIIACRAAAMDHRNADAGNLLLLHVMLHDVVDIFMKGGVCQINAVAHRRGGLRQGTAACQQEDHGGYASRC